MALALAYPFPVPSGSFLFRAEAALLPIAEADFEGRVPVLAYGSNRAPAQLQRKFAGVAGRDGEVPVTGARLMDYDVVFSAHITRYGAIAATLSHHPGVSVELALTWLTPGQLRRMHATEGGNYPFGRLRGADLTLLDGPEGRVEEVSLYLGRFGCLAEGGEALGLAAVPAAGRRLRALAQSEAQELLRRRYHRDETLSAAILANIADARRRARLNARLAAEALPVSAPHFQPEGPD